MLDSYRITYLVESRAGDYSASTDRITVRRPFEAREDTNEGPPPGKTSLGSTIYALNRLRTQTATLPAPPGAAGPDRRPDTMLRDAVRDGYAAARERRRIAHRTCRVYRFSGDAGGGLSPLASAGQSYSDMCFDDAGLMLEQVTYSSGSAILRRLATSVEENPKLSGALFRTGAVTVEPRIGGVTRQVTDESRPPGAKFWEVGDLPDGFKHVGRYAVVPPGAGTETAGSGTVYASIVDLFSRGPDEFEVEQGGTLNQSAPFETDPDSLKVKLGPLGRGELFYGLSSNVVRVRMASGRFLRVEGTVPRGLLLGVARGLQENGPGEITYLDRQP